MPGNDYKDAMAIKVQDVTVKLQETRIKDLEDALRKARNELQEQSDQIETLESDLETSEDNVSHWQVRAENAESTITALNQILLDTLESLGVDPLDANLALASANNGAAAQGDPPSLTASPYVSNRLAGLVKNTKDYRRAGSR